MAWIELDDGIWDHYKTSRLCSLLGLPDVVVVGHLVSLWHFTLRTAWRDASLELWGDDGIERGARWGGERGKFVSALRESGFMDGYVMHGWMERAGRLITDRLRKEAQRQETARRLSESCRGKSAPCPGKSAPCRGKSELHNQPNPTNLTNPTQPEGQATIKNGGRRLKTAGDEKNRREGKGGASAFSLPSWIDPVIWSNYCEMRVKIRKPMTEAAKGLIVGKLEGFKNMGHPANEVLKQSIEKSWTGVFPLKDGANGYPGATLGPSGLHKVNPADAYLSEMSRLDKVEAFHAEHTKGGKCAFCGKDLPKFGYCDCEAYLKAWREVEAKEATCQPK